MTFNDRDKMPRKKTVLAFHFEDKSRATPKKFSCDIECKRCTAKTSDGRECKRTVCIGLPYCFQHLESKMKLKVKDTRYGKGVFAWDKDKAVGATTFKKGDLITKYEGETLTKKQLEARYGKDSTAPYGIQSGKKYIDLACTRGIGGLFNHSDEEGKRSASLVEYRDRVGAPWGIAVEADKNVRNKKQIYVSYHAGSNNRKKKYRFNENNVHFTKRVKNK